MPHFFCPKSSCLVKVTNLLGQIVLTELIPQEKTQIDIRNLDNGIHFIKVYNNNSKQTIKLIKE